MKPTAWLPAIDGLSMALTRQLLNHKIQRKLRWNGQNVQSPRFSDSFFQMADELGAGGCQTLFEMPHLSLTMFSPVRDLVGRYPEVDATPRPRTGSFAHRNNSEFPVWFQFRKGLFFVACRSETEWDEGEGVGGVGEKQGREGRRRGQTPCRLEAANKTLQNSLG